MWCVCAQSYMVQSKKIFDHFICFWKWFLSLFVFMFSVYIVFHCFTMFCIEKQVSVFFAAQLVTCQSRAHLEAFGDSLAACSRLTRDSRLARDSLATRKNFRDWTSWLAQSRNAQKQLFKGFFVGNLFYTSPILSKNPLSIFLHQNPTNLNDFHSINISKVFINSFY